MELPGLALAQLAHDGRFPLVVIPTCDPSQAAEKLKFRIGSNSKLTQVMVEVFVHPRAPLVRRECAEEGMRGLPPNRRGRILEDDSIRPGVAGP